MQCFQKLNNEQKQIVFENFYKLQTKNEQDIYLQGLIHQKNVAKRTIQENERRKLREVSFDHFIRVGELRVKVCCAAFLSLHAISKKRIKRIKSLIKINATPTDKRGKNIKRVIPEDQNILIRQHIESYPVKESHYSGKEYKYLDSRLNVKIMFEMFETKYPETKIKYSYYYTFFRDNFTLKFGRPQIDTCVKCEELNLKIKSPSLGDAAKKAAVAEMMVHKRRAKKFYNTLKDTIKECHDRDDMVGLVFDYMQNVHLPHIPVQEVFYKTQLTVNVFCIHNLKTQSSFFYIYHEGQANKGPNDVCTFLLDYIKTNIPSNVKNLKLFCDNCPGQNKNHCIVRLCLALTDMKRFEKIDHFFPIRGHSFLPCDRDFGVVKRSLKKFDRIFDIHKYTEIIVNSSAKRKFTVKEVQTNEILDFKQWWPKYYKKTCLSTESEKKNVPRAQKTSFGISILNHYAYSSETPGYVVASEYINSIFGVSHFRLALPKQKSHLNMEWPTVPAYPDGMVPILESKINHLQCLNQWVPEDKQDFYIHIINFWKTKKPKAKTSK